VNATAAAGSFGYVDTALAPNTAYTYTVNAVNASGLPPAVNGVASSTSATTQYAAAGALTGVVATYAAVPAGVTVGWTGGTPATAYLVERCTASAANLNCAAPTSVWAPAWTVNAPAGSYFDASVVANTTYAYRVTAKNGPVNLSNTLTALVTTPAALVVNTPTGLTAALSFAPANITLTWTDAATNETAFVIERSTDGVNFTQVGTALPRTGTTGQTRTFADTAVSAGQSYWYRVMAQNVTGAVVTNSAPTAPVKVDFFLTAPSGLTAAIASATRVNLSWVDQSTAETAFAVWRSDNGAAAVQIGTVTRSAAQGTAVGGPVTFSNNNSVATPLVLGHTYTYTVTAVNGAVASVASNSFSVPFVAPAAPAPLAAPTLALTSATRATVTLNWPAVAGATSYTVQRQSTAGSNAAWTTLTTANVLTVTETNVRRSATPYVYQIRANGPAGSSAYTQSSFVIN
jgi:titin